MQINCRNKWLEICNKYDGGFQQKIAELIIFSNLIFRSRHDNLQGYAFAYK